MANFKISQLPPASSVATEDLLPIVKVSELETQKATAGQIVDLASESITSMPNLIIEPETNFTDFSTSVREQFTGGDGIEIIGGVINSTVTVTDPTEVLGSSNIDVSFDGTSQYTVSLNTDLTGIDTIQANQITASFSGNGSNLTDITTASIPTFTEDVRTRFTAGDGITITDGEINVIGFGENVGDITSVTAGDNLTGGGTSGDVTISLKQILTDITSITGLTSSFAILSGTTAISGSQITGSISGSFAKFTTISGSVISGSQITGSISGSTAQFTSVTGSITGAIGRFATELSASRITGSISGSSAQFTSFTGSITGSIARFATELSASRITGSISGSSAQFTSVTGSTISGSQISGTFLRGDGSNIINIQTSNISNFSTNVRSQFTAGPGIKFGATGQITSSIQGGSNMSIATPSAGNSYIINLSEDLTGLNSISSSQITGAAVDINGGRIDGTIIGSTSPANGTFNNLVVNGNSSIGNGTSDIALVKGYFYSAHTFHLASKASSDIYVTTSLSATALRQAYTVIVNDSNFLTHSLPSPADSDVVGQVLIFIDQKDKYCMITGSIEGGTKLWPSNPPTKTASVGRVILISDGVVWRVISHVNATAYEDLIES
jgi:hypothetical protein